MAEDRDQLVDEQAMDTMSVAPPDPKTEAIGSEIESDTSSEGMPKAPVAGVDDQDPLSAHPT